MDVCDSGNLRDEDYRDSLKTAFRWSVLLVVYIAYRCWNEGTAYTATFRADGQVAIVTGPSSGVGRQTAAGLAARGARVYLAGRHRERGLAAEQQIRADTGNPDVHYLHLNLGSLASVRSFAADFAKREQHLHLLVNNAAVLMADGDAGGGENTVDGFEMHMGVNHYGPFLLTSLLMPHLQRSGPSRIVNVTSAGHGWAGKSWLLPLGQQQLPADGCGPIRRYLRSKLANVLFTKELGRRLASDSGVTVNCVHPGWNRSRLARNLGPVTALLHRLVGVIFLRSCWAAAQSVLYAAIDVNLVSMQGEYFADQWVSKSATNGDDPAMALELWQLSEQVTGAKFNV